MSLVANALATEEQLAGVFELGSRDEAGDAIELSLVHQRTDGVCILLIPNILLLCLHRLLVFFDELVVNALLDIDAARGEGHLAGICSDGVCAPCHCIVQIAVIEYNGWALASKFQ